MIKQKVSEAIYDSDIKNIDLLVRDLVEHLDKFDDFFENRNMCAMKKTLKNMKNTINELSTILDNY